MSVRRRAEYKLYYFQSEGRAEIARLILAYAKVPYDDIRYSREEWPQHKSRMPFGQMPVLEYRGQMLPQSNVIARFLAHRHGLGGDNEWTAAQIDAYVALIADAVDGMVKVYMLRHDEAKMKEALENYIKTNLVPTLELLEKRLEDNGTGYMFGNKVTLADLVVFNFYENNKMFRITDPLTNSKLVTKLFNTIGEIPNIKEWISKRPPNQMI